MGHDFSLEEVRYSLHITTMTLRSRGSFWSDDVWLVALLSSTFDLEMLTLGHSPLVLMMILWDDSLYQMLTFQMIILHWELTHSEMMHSHWGIATLPILTLRFHLLLWLLLSMDYIVIGTLGSVFSAYLVRFGYPLSFVTHLSVLRWTLLYLHPSYQSLTSFEPTDSIVLHDLIHFFRDQRRM